MPKMIFLGPHRQMTVVVNKTRVTWQNTRTDEKMVPAKMDLRVPLMQKIHCGPGERRQGEPALRVSGHI
jgi:hypothetical protein